MSRLFDDQSLQRLARAPEHDAIAALARGDLPALQRHLDDMDSGSAGLDALSGHTLARKIGKLRADFGEERTRAELRRIGAMLMRSWVEQWRTGDAKGAITDLVAVFKHQGGTALAPLQEDDDAVVLDAYRGTGYRVVPIDSRDISDDGHGSIHCLTMAYPPGSRFSFTEPR